MFYKYSNVPSHVELSSSALIVSSKPYSPTSKICFSAGSLAIAVSSSLFVELPIPIAITSATSCREPVRFCNKYLSRVPNQ